MQPTVQFLVRHGYMLLFAMVLTEQLGVPIPAIPVLLAMGALAGLGLCSFGAALSLTMIAALAADSAWYILGRQRGHSVLKWLCRVSLEPDSCVSTTRSWFKKLGAWVLVICKFVPGLSAVSTPMAGLSRIPWWKFLVADAAGSLLWAFTFLALGYVFRAQLEDVGRIALHLGSGLGAVIGALLALWIGWKFWQRKRFLRSLRIARISPEQVLTQMDEMVIVDLRTRSEMERDGFKLRGALWYDQHTLEVSHSEIPRDRDVVLYCT